MSALTEQLGMSVPVVAAPMGGGPSTPALVAAVGDAGGLGFLAGAYRTTDELRGQIAETRALTDRPFGVNVFVPGRPAEDRTALDAYAERLRPVADRLGVALGEPDWDDDDYGGKVEVLVEERVPVASFTFGLPRPEDVDRLHQVGTLVVVTVTSVAEALQAADRGADALCAQGAEAGAHRGAFLDDAAASPGAGALGLEPLVSGVTSVVPLPVIAAGGLMTGEDVAGALAGGASSAQLGTAFLCCPEAGTSAVHRRALLGRCYDATGFTRAFTGRTARGLVNGFFRDHTDAAPAGYPEVHHLTRPLRSAAAARGDMDSVHLWAGQGWTRVREVPAATLVEQLAAELRGTR